MYYVDNTLSHTRAAIRSNWFPHPYQVAAVTLSKRRSRQHPFQVLRRGRSVLISGRRLPPCPLVRKRVFRPPRRCRRSPSRVPPHIPMPTYPGDPSQLYLDYLLRLITSPMTNPPVDLIPAPNLTTRFHRRKETKTRLTRVPAPRKHARSGFQISLTTHTRCASSVGRSRGSIIGEGRHVSSKRLDSPRTRERTGTVSQPRRG